MGSFAGPPRMKTKHLALALAAMMCMASVAGVAIRPGTKAADKGDVVQLESLVPTEFAEWRLVQDAGAQVVNPQTQQLLDKLYSQVLNRTYVNKQGYRVMLSIAYGDDQRGGLQAHRPEVCYPAQGFKLHNQSDGALATSYGSIEVRRLATSLGPRHEPVTYWLTVGDQVIQSRLDKRIAEFRLGLTGQIPDGVLFRVSSIDPDETRAYEMQRAFTAALMSAVPPQARQRLGGLRTKSDAI